MSEAILEAVLYLESSKSKTFLTFSSTTLLISALWAAAPLTACVGGGISKHYILLWRLLNYAHVEKTPIERGIEVTVWV